MILTLRDLMALSKITFIVKIKLNSIAFLNFSLDSRSRERTYSAPLKKYSSKNFSVLENKYHRITKYSILTSKHDSLKLENKIKIK